MNTNNKLIPYRVPMFEDPRIMLREKLIYELTQRGLNTKGRSSVLSARLLAHIVREGLKDKITPDDMDDRQPEKWLHIANLAFEAACNFEENPDARLECMTRSNYWIETTVVNNTQLLDVARGTFYPENETPAFLALLRFGAALMVQPTVEEEAVRSANVTSDIVRGSVFIFQLCTGFSHLPEHLTEGATEIDEQIKEKANPENIV